MGEGTEVRRRTTEQASAKAQQQQQAAKEAAFGSVLERRRQLPVSKPVASTGRGAPRSAGAAPFSLERGVLASALQHALISQVDFGGRGAARLASPAEVQSDREPSSGEQGGSGEQNSGGQNSGGQNSDQQNSNGQSSGGHGSEQSGSGGQERQAPSSAPTAALAPTGWNSSGPAAQPTSTSGSPMDAAWRFTEFSASFNLQYLQLQEQSQLDGRQFNMLSNIMKSNHSGVMQAINNIR